MLFISKECTNLKINLLVFVVKVGLQTSYFVGQFISFRLKLDTITLTITLTMTIMYICAHCVTLADIGKEHYCTMFYCYF